VRSLVMSVNVALAAFALCAALTVTLPNSAVHEKSVNYLTLHVFLKTCVYSGIRCEHRYHA
jgi:hypothetical protein